MSLMPGLLGRLRKPTGWMGQLVAMAMNRGHRALTAWGLGHVVVGPQDMVLDIGCGGGQAVRKLAEFAAGGTVFGIDYSADSVAVARRRNADQISAGHVDIHRGSASELP